MARKTKADAVNANAVNVNAETVLSALGVTLGDSFDRVPVESVLTYREASEDADAPQNVGRDGVHTDARVKGRAVTLYHEGQRTPIIVTSYKDQMVVVDGAGRVEAMRLVAVGFDSNGKTYAPVADCNLIVRTLSRTDGKDMPLADIVTAGRYLNLSTNMDGVAGPISAAKTAQRLRTTTGKKGKDLYAALAECGIDTDQTKDSRGAAALRYLPTNMLDAVQLNEIEPGKGIGFSVLHKHLIRQAAGLWAGQVKAPTDAQFTAFVAKATYQTVRKVDGKDVIVPVTDYRGVVIDAWYDADFDVSSPAFGGWKPDGKTVPQTQSVLTAVQESTTRDLFKWSVLKTKIAADSIAAPLVVGHTMREIFRLFDSVAYSSDEATRLTRLTAGEAVKQLQALLSSLSDGSLEVPEPAAKVVVGTPVPGIGDFGKSAD